MQSASSATVPAWIQTAITINAGTLNITGCAGIDNPVDLSYAAVLAGATCSIKGATATAAGAMLLAAAAGADDNKPRISFSRMVVENTAGVGVDLRSAHFDVGQLDVQCAGYGMAGGESVSSTSYRGGASIGHLISKDTGTPTTGAVVFATSYALPGYDITIKKATQLDTRGTKAGFFAEVGSGNAAGLLIGELVSPESIPAVNWIGTDKYYRLSGARWTGALTAPAVFVCQGDPSASAFLPAPVGSLALRLDGGVGTSLYVKQAGTGTAGWAGK